MERIRQQEFLEFKEIDLRANLDIMHNAYQIEFDSKDQELISVYNIAINKINLENKLGLFHQSGIGDNVGYHSWEVLGSDADEKKLESIIPLIHLEAKKIYLHH